MSLALKIAPALVLSALLLSPAAAAPVGPNTMGAVPDSLLIEVRDGGHGRGHGGHRHGGRGHHGKNHGHHGGRHHGHHGGRFHGHPHHWHHGGRWVPGRTYYIAPPGWRQYGARPWNWQALGCVVVNGFWFCP